MAIAFKYEQIVNDNDLLVYNNSNGDRIEIPDTEKFTALYQDSAIILNLVFQRRLFYLTDQFNANEELIFNAGDLAVSSTAQAHDYALIQKMLMAMVLDANSWLSFLEQTIKVDVEFSGGSTSGTISAYDPNRAYEVLPSIVKFYLRSCSFYKSVQNNDPNQLLNISYLKFVEFEDLTSDNIEALSTEWNDGEPQSMTLWMGEVRKAIIESEGETGFTSGIFVNPEDDPNLEWPNIDTQSPSEFVSQQQINIANREFHFSLRNIDELLQSQIDDIKINNSTILNIKQVVPSNTISLVDGVREELRFNTSGGGSVIDPLGGWDGSFSYLIDNALHGKDIRNQGSLTFNITGATPNASLNIHYKILSFGGGSTFETTYSINIPNPDDDEITIPFFNDLITIEDVSGTKILTLEISSNGDDFDFTLLRANWSVDVVGADTILTITNPYRLNELKEYETDQGASYTDKFNNVWTRTSDTFKITFDGHRILSQEFVYDKTPIKGSWDFVGNVGTFPDHNIIHLYAIADARANYGVVPVNGGNTMIMLNDNNWIFISLRKNSGGLEIFRIEDGSGNDQKIARVGIVYTSNDNKQKWEYKLTTVGAKYIKEVKPSKKKLKKKLK